MKQRIAAHLSTLFPQVKGVDFGVLEQLGPTTVNTMVEYVKAWEIFIGDEIVKEENLLDKIGSGETVDVMSAIEIGARISYLRTKLGNRKKTTLALKAIYATVARKGEQLPLLPVLRNKYYFAPGDDVMLYIGETGFESERYPYQRKEIVSTFNWVCAKLLDYHEWENKPVFKAYGINRILLRTEDVLDGHVAQGYALSPFIFKRSEFFRMRELLKIHSIHSDTVMRYMRNAQFYHHDGYRRITEFSDAEKIVSIILDENVEDISEETLNSNEASLVVEMAKKSEKYEHYCNQVTKLAKHRMINIARIIRP